MPPVDAPVAYGVGSARLRWTSVSFLISVIAAAGVEGRFKSVDHFHGPVHEGVYSERSGTTQPLR
jgi:hypothetical protein